MRASISDFDEKKEEEIDAASNTLYRKALTE
jgi:hypothetical protein